MVTKHSATQRIQYSAYLCISPTVAVYHNSGFASLFLPVCVLLDAGWGHHALSTGGESVWKSSREVVLPSHTGMGWAEYQNGRHAYTVLLSMLEQLNPSLYTHQHQIKLPVDVGLDGYHQCQSCSVFTPRAAEQVGLRGYSPTNIFTTGLSPPIVMHWKYLRK